MKNRGSVTIFCCFIITAMVILGITTIKVVSHHLARAKGAVVVRSAMSGMDAGYNSYIFENYHILLFDKNCDGKGEAYLEEQLIQDIQHNLGDGFVVDELGAYDYDLILENECEGFKEQLGDYCGYALLEGGASAILESTDGQDGTVADYIYEDMEAAKDSAFTLDFDMENTEQGHETAEADEQEEPDLDIQMGKTDDPRDFTKNLTSDGILAMVAPEDLEISSQVVELDGVPSLENKQFNVLNYEIDNDFDDMDIMKEDMGEFDSWKDSLVDGGVGIIYAANVFNCATDEVLEETVFAFELEYLICGSDSDKDNLKGVVNRILGIRFPVNYAYLVSDVAKMGEVTKLSVPIALATLVPEPIVRYLITGCWAYVEAIFDVRCLLDGQSMDFFKNRANWKTDLTDLENSVNLDGEEADGGLGYRDYLLILMALDMDSAYYRMLDIIELNTKQHYENFDMNNAALGFSVDAQISYEDKSYFYRESIGY